MNPSLLRSAVLLVALTATLFGCATPAPPAISPVWTSRQAALTPLTHWRAAGRIGVVNAEDGWHASFQWDQQGPDYRIDLIGPLGQGRVLLQGTATGVTLQTQDGQQWTAPDADALVEQHLQIHLPVNGLRYWILGLPEPGAPPVLHTDAQGRLTRLEQKGWLIDYPAYAPLTPIELPARIMAQRQDLSVKLIIEQWTR